MSDFENAWLNLSNKIYYNGETVIDHLFAINSGFEFIEFNQLPGNKHILNNRAVISNLVDIKNVLWWT